MPGPAVDISTYRRTRKPRGRPRSPQWRLRIWQFALIAGVVGIVVRLYYLQIHQGGDLTSKAYVQRQKTNFLVHRGAITDRHGLPLAIDTTRYDIFVHPRLLKVSKEEAADKIAKITGKPEDRVLKLLNGRHPVVTVAKHLEREVVDQLQKLNWTGLDIVPRPFRHYPEGTMAAHLLGYVNIDTAGQGGVEQSQQETLTSTGKIPKPQLDGRGKTILLPHKGPTWDITPPLGRHVELTIDNSLQHLAEKELFAMAAHSQCSKATAIIMDPTNGEILAWANYPTYDPNDYSKFPFGTLKNWAMVDVYQPGSTFKVITVSSGLETGKINEHVTFSDSGAFSIGRRTIHNSHGGNGTIDLLHLFIHSSNIGAAKVALRMTPKEFYDKLYDFGLGRKTGIDLPGESKGLLLNWKRWKPIDQATTGFGQGAIAVTPLQLVAAVGTVANAGTWVQPHLIRRTYDPRTGVTEKWTEPERRQVLKPEIARHVSRLLADNITQGSQIAGKSVPGYRVAGKTGTAQKVREGGRGYIHGQTIASFVGFLPYDDPQLLCLVAVDNPQTDGRWGNTVAGPVFNAIAREAARLLAIPESYKTEVIKGKFAGPDGKPVPLSEAPSVKYAADLQKIKKQPDKPPKPVNH
ncbi:MAG: penicillin-binding protein 2 [Candidatus Obscuribacterales bacterium]|nr:penicillin-binding protein 2 [Candidatus Obscuribacterales bacterium]